MMTVVPGDIFISWPSLAPPTTVSEGISGTSSDILVLPSRRAAPAGF
jgi:hypothetical protein